MSLPPLRPLLPALALLLAPLLAHPQPSTAAERGDIERMHQAGRTAEALQRIEQALAADPREPGLRFQKAVMLADAGRTREAEDIYLRLTQEYPELPEPHNNLAVLQAAQGRLDEAREALETALRADPSYVTAQENLGDVYVRLAVRAYERAGHQDAAVQRKLQLARQLTTLGAARRS